MAAAVIFSILVNFVDNEPFNDEAARKKAVKRVLEAAPYNGECEEIDFAINWLAGGLMSPTFDFYFTAIKGRETQCPSISVSVDKETGEVWLLRM